MADKIVIWDGERVRQVPPLPTEHTILVAFTVEADNRRDAHTHLMDHLPSQKEFSANGAPITSWWVAEDDRLDGSDCDSAVFVNPGAQAQAIRVLYNTIAVDPHTGLRHDPPVPLTAICNLQGQGERTLLGQGPVNMAFDGGLS